MTLTPRDFSAARKNIRTQQRDWATRTGLELENAGYCLSDDANLFGGLSDVARRDFEGGDGSELSTATRRGKIRAVHSSSALACNVFDYWRARNHDVLSNALGLSAAFVKLRLEGKFATGCGRDANLDVILTGPGDSIHAIESKFCEPYSHSKSKTSLKPKYFDDGVERWTEVGLSGCQAVAESLRRGEHDFHVLDVAQLLKHMLALARTDKPWSLSCLWFEVPGAVAERHRLELDRLRALIRVPTFAALTYQELFDRLGPHLGKQHQPYFAYVTDRYLST